MSIVHTKYLVLSVIAYANTHETGAGAWGGAR